MSDSDQARSISFLASLPPIQSAIMSGGDGSMRIKLDIPASEQPNVVPLLALTGCVLRINIEVEPRPEREPLINNEEQYAVSERQKRQPRWKTS